MDGVRIVSLLPAATEMACALGLAEQIVGVSHECAHPNAIAARPKLTRSALPAGLTQGEIDAFVTARLRSGESLYEIDAALLRTLAPDLILTQDLCEVCGVSSRELDVVCELLQNAPLILRFSPKALADVHENLRALGEATGRSAAAERIIADARTRASFIANRLAGVPRPRVFCMEWLDPPYCSGHWVAEMVEIAGGRDALSRKGSDSVRVAWEDVVAWAPEVLILMPCGLGIEQVIRHAEILPVLPRWTELPAVRHDRVFAVDADAYFARPGPRLSDGLELLARILHPEFEWPAIEAAAAPLCTKRCEGCGTLFLCRTSTGCWCESVCVPPSVLTEFRESWSDCLCRACLHAGRTHTAGLTWTPKTPTDAHEPSA
jgi:iron complex transport system substrate-binding protein